MAISRGRELVSHPSPAADEVRKSIAALILDASHVQKCINAGVHDPSSGQATINEILDLIQQLRQKLPHWE